MDKVSKAAGAKVTDEITAAVEAVLAAHGMEKGKIRWTYGDGYSIKIEASLLNVNDNGVNVSSAEAQYFVYAVTLPGMLTEDEATSLIGAKWRQGTDEYQLLGWNSRARKRPIVIRRLSDGAKMVAPERVLIPLMEQNASHIDAERVNALLKWHVEGVLV